MPPPLRDLLADYDADAPLAEARTIPGAWYTDPRVLDLERRAVFGASWQLVARADQVARPGDYVTADVAGEPIVVVRGHDGVLRAFYNVCRHHAAAVMTEPAGCAERLRCPYHGWTYSLEGRLVAAPELEAARRFDRADNGLVPVHVEAWGLLVFVHLGERPPPLGVDQRHAIEGLAPLGLGALTFVGRREWTLACNWKVFVDNYLDGGYHIPFLHRDLASILPFREYTIETFDRSCLQSSRIDPAGGEAMIASVRRDRAAYWWLYPNLMLNGYDGYLDTNLVVPVGPSETKVIFDFYFADVSPERQAENARSIAASERIQDEDHAICASVQRGLASRAYGSGRLSPRREAGEHLFHRLLAADLRA